MRTNEVADTIYTYLIEKHNRVYRGKAPQSPATPYVVFRVESVVDTYPSEEQYVNVDIYDKEDTGVRAIENLADLIDGDGLAGNPSGLNRKIFNTDKLNMHFEREQRQHIPSEELVGVQAVNLRYAVRTYYK